MSADLNFDLYFMGNIIVWKAANAQLDTIQHCYAHFPYGHLS